jgi:arginine decarboxylase
VDIVVTAGIGRGHTERSAFDVALAAAGVANFNLVRLSSIIPPQACVHNSATAVVPPGQWGDRLYVVMAKHCTSSRNTRAWAGLGWAQDETSGRGLLIEHHGTSEADVERDILDSLKTLADNRNLNLSEPRMRIVGATCTEGALCALAVASYTSTPWQ